ncbi:MAG: lamin tail domain-containing protein [Bacilli bacterium]|nr:lamin tail domain-containing protein [Bacilli bacterium]
MKKIFMIICLFVLVILLLEFFPNLKGEYIMTDKLYISEMMASNYATIKDDDGDYSDYIEIYNGYNNSISLKNYYLSDSEFETNKWSFPDIEIQGHEYLIVYASGKDKCDLESRICHTNFKLSSKGEVLTLTDNNGNIISKITYPKMDTDVSFSYKDRQYILFNDGTPGKKNKGEKFKTSNIDYSKIKINEYMTDNKRSYYDLYGNYFDWVELYNDSEQDITLKNMFITDNESNLKKFKIKETIISKKGYLIVHMPGKKVGFDEGIYTDFGLSSDDKKIIISDGKKIIDEVEIVELKQDVSYGKKNDRWQYFTTPTPGYENNTSSFDGIGGKNGNA